MPIPNGIVKKDESVYWGADGEFLLFVPEFFFDMKFAVIDGEYITLMGLLTYAIITNGKMGNIRQFYFPSMFTTKPGKIEKVKNFDISDDYKVDCRIFHYTNNKVDQIFTSTRIPQDIENVENLFRITIQNGKTPNTIRYDELQNYPVDSMEINGNAFGINIGLFGIVYGELCKDPNDLSKPFRLSSVIDKDMCGYKEISIVDAPKYISPYASITSENFDEGIIGAMLTDSKAKESTPLEKVFVG